MAALLIGGIQSCAQGHRGSDPAKSQALPYLRRRSCLRSSLRCDGGRMSDDRSLDPADVLALAKHGLSAQDTYVVAASKRILQSLNPRDRTQAMRVDSNDLQMLVGYAFRSDNARIHDAARRVLGTSPRSD